MNDSKIKVLLVEPEKYPKEIVIDDSLEAMQEVVGGDIEEYMPYDDDVAIICNEEGKMRGLPLNRAVYVQDNDKKEMVDIICGKFFICYAPPESESFQSLPDDMMKKYKEQFKYPERFSKEVGGNIVAEPFKPKSKDYEKLLKLKGIGSYTAGAIASIAYQIPVPAVDGNVFRILTRVAADDTDIMKPSFRSLLEKELREVMQGMEMPGAFNQALMELGATVCVPNGAPLCEQCPWNRLCLARKEGRIAELPVRTKAKARRIEKRTVLVIRDNDKVAIRKRPEKGLLAGLYELPNVEGRYSQDEIVHLVKDMHLSPIRVQKLENAKHIFSHIEWQMEGYAILVEEAGFDAEAEKMAENHLIFVDAEKSQEKYAIPSAFAAYAKYMGIRLGNEKFLETD